MAFKYLIGSVNTKLFVGGLNYNTSDQTLSEFFGKFGNVAECVVMKFPDSGESRGFGFVTFSSEQEVEWCLSSLPLSLDGKNVDVKRAEAPTRDGTKVGGGVRDGVKRKGGDASCKVFVGGLNYNTGEDMLKQVFSRYGKVNDWIIMKFPDSGESRGFGFVTFSSADEVERCLINQPIIVDGKSVDIKKAEPPSARAPVNNKQTKPMSRFKYQKDKESCIDNKLPRGGGTMADICNGGNQCGGGFGNNCGHDTFSTIASQVVAMTTNHHKLEPVKEEVQDYSKYYQEYSKWYASWRQYNEYLQQEQGASSAQPPLPPGERPKTPPQQENKQPQNKPSIQAEPQYNQEYFTGSSSSDQGHHSQYRDQQQPQTTDQCNQDKSSQYRKSTSSDQDQPSHYTSSSDQGHHSQFWEGSTSNQGQTSRYGGQHQAQTADQYNQYSSSAHQAQPGDQYNKGHPSQYRGQQQAQNGHQYNEYHDGGRGNGRQQYNQKQQQRKRRNQSPPSWVPQFNQSAPHSNNDGSSYNNDNDGANYNNDGQSYNSEGPSYNYDGSSYNNDGRNFNSDGKNYNNSDRRSNSNNGNNYSNNSRNNSNGGGGHSDSNYNGHKFVEPERNEFYQQNLETQKRKKMRMSS